MSCRCNEPNLCEPNVSPGFRKALWVALFVNLIMFFVEVIGGMEAGSAALWADAVDFAGDSANYAISLFVLSLALVWRSRAALAKGLTMAIFGIFVFAKSLWVYFNGIPPETTTMTMIGLLALTANAGVALMLYRYRGGDANMRSVWLCSRNDAIGNLAIIGAAIGVAVTNSVWPDLLVAVVMAALALHSGVSVVIQAKLELSKLKLNNARG